MRYATILESPTVYSFLGLERFIPTFGRATHGWLP
jgi:hypothetical protein